MLPLLHMDECVFQSGCHACTAALQLALCTPRSQSQPAEIIMSHASPLVHRPTLDALDPSRIQGVAAVIGL